MDDIGIGVREVYGFGDLEVLNGQTRTSKMYVTCQCFKMFIDVVWPPIAYLFQDVYRCFQMFEDDLWPQ